MSTNRNVPPVVPVKPPAQFTSLHKRGLADDLVMQATAMLNMAARLRGDMVSMPMPAEFQALDIMRDDFDRRVTQYRAVIGNAD
jgi:hypothetical protein